MKILAIEKDVEGVDWENEQETLENEAKVVYLLSCEGLIREIYFTENKIAVLILECENIAKASEVLNTLPLVKKGLIAFDVMELRPYTGIDRILK
jgi:hypothetical protein